MLKCEGWCLSVSVSDFCLYELEVRVLNLRTGIEFISRSLLWLDWEALFLGGLIETWH